MAQLSLTLLGGFQATLAGAPLSHFRSTKYQALLAYLALQPGQAHARAHLADLLWPDATEEDARRNLRQALFLLRNLLKPENAPTSADEVEFLIVTPQTVQFDARQPHWIDVATFTNLLDTCGVHAHGARSRCPTCIVHLQEAVALYQGAFLQGIDVGEAAPLEEWITWQRQRLQEQVLDALADLADWATSQADLPAAQRLALRQVEIDRLAERGHRQLMRALAQRGLARDAISAYEKCRRLLRTELDVAPAPETLALYQEIKQGKWAPRRGDKVTGDKVTSLAEGARSVTLSPLHPVTLSPPHPLIDWGEAPMVTAFYGRRVECQRVAQWLSGEECRLVALLGMGGIGKTSLAATVVQQVSERYEVVLWRSLLNAPPLAELLREWVQRLAGNAHLTWPTRLDEQLGLLFQQLRVKRCLLVLDNMESIFTGAERAGYARPAYEDYGQLLLLLGQGRHRSCLLLTSREKPHAVQQMAENPAVRLLELSGLDAEAGWAMMQRRGLRGDMAQVKTLLHYYSGNPLALKLVSETIEDFFGGDIAAFLAGNLLLFDDIRDVLDQHFDRLTPLERDLLLWLAVEREPRTVTELQATLAPAPCPPNGVRDLLEAVRSLQRRSLIETTSQGLTLQNVINEYAIAALIDQICTEIETQQPQRLHSHALLKAQAKVYVRQSQARLLLQPIGERLLGKLGQTGLLTALHDLLDQVRQTGTPAWVSQESYAGGNLLNLLLHLALPTHGTDFSQLTIRQASLRGVHAPGLNLRGADLRDCTFTDRFGWISSLAFHPTGEFLAAGTADFTVRLWRLTDGQDAGALVGHTNTVEAVAYSPDGALLASAGHDGVVRLWDVRQPEQGRLLRTLQGHTHLVFAVAFSPDGQRVASSGADCTVRLWDVTSGELLTTLQGHQDRVFEVAFHPAGQQLVSASDDQTIRLWDLDGTLVRTFSGHTREVRAVAFSPDGRLLVSGSFDQCVLVWDVASGQLRHRLTGHQQPINAVAVSPDGQTIASGGDDLLVRLWDSHTGQLRQLLHGHSKRVNFLTFCPSHAGRSPLLASGGDDQTVRLWEVGVAGRAELRQTWQGHTSWVWAVACSPDGALIAAAREDQTIQLWDAQSGEQRHLLQGHTQRIYDLAFSADSQTLVSGSDDRTVRLWRVGDSPRAGQHPLVIEGHPYGVRAVAMSADRRFVACGSTQETVSLWELQSAGGVVRCWESTAHPQRIYHVAFTPDDKTLASASADHTIALWDVASGAVRTVLRGHTRQVFAMALSPDGRLLASGSGDQTIRLWDVATGDLLQIFTGHTNWVWSVAFSPDGALLVSGGADQRVRLWHVQRGAPLHTLPGHSGVVYSVAFSPATAAHPLLVVSGSMDETVKLWDAKTGVCLRTLRPHGPYEGMQINGVTGLTQAQQATLRALGAVEEG